ncbi:hypothetical protein Nepgr_012528 [Nepenthes gracilis]|uniref:Uncharacterized protein n=1 Tax=Nepenthes gracilis TaxID=150966 RepID=A0AAD3SG99_NEPGR|nr:hypothetical protein Nepgr_012528 [Nepenthes gracilis]
MSQPGCNHQGLEAAGDQRMRSALSALLSKQSSHSRFQLNSPTQNSFRVKGELPLEIITYPISLFATDMANQTIDTDQENTYAIAAYKQ